MRALCSSGYIDLLVNLLVDDGCYLITQSQVQQHLTSCQNLITPLSFSVRKCVRLSSQCQRLVNLYYRDGWQRD
jgi:hypothetical protein